MYSKEHGLYVAHGPNGPISICGKMANRHGLIAGATGTGKTVTLQVLAETCPMLHGRHEGRPFRYQPDRIHERIH